MNKYTAIIIEPRKHNALEFVLNNFISNLGCEKWRFILYHSESNSVFVNDIINRLKITFNELIIDPHHDSKVDLKYTFLFTLDFLSSIMS
jgi:hypothetical protein